MLGIARFVIAFLLLFGRRSAPVVVVGDHGIVCQSYDAIVCRLSWSQAGLEADSWRIYSLVGGHRKEECRPARIGPPILDILR